MTHAHPDGAAAPAPGLHGWRIGLLRAAGAALLGLLLSGCPQWFDDDDETPAQPPAVLPAVATGPAAQAVEAGQPATFSVTLSAGTEPVVYQWLRNGTAVTGATGASYSIAATTEADDGARFQVRLSNMAGSVTSAEALLTVRPRPVPPTLQALPQPVTVNEGQPAVFSVNASSNAGALGYQWLRGGVPISGATGASYTLPTAAPADDGARFSVQVSNSAGMVPTPEVVLSVVVLPRITAQPTPATLVVGQTATFSVAATGTAPLQYQWQRNGAAVPGATSASFTTPSLTLADDGSLWSVVVRRIGNSNAPQSPTTRPQPAKTAKTGRLRQ
jgi:beta-galactosidase